MRLVLLYPGSKSEPVKLQDVMRESHEAFAAGVALEIERRQKLGVPLDDATDWDAVDVAVKAKDGPKVAALVSGNTLRPVPAYDPTEGYDDVVVRFVALSESQRRDLSLAVALASDDLDKARVAGDIPGVRAADERLDQARGAFVRAAICSLFISGVSLEGIDADDLEAVRASGLLVDLYVAARDYQRLSPGKGGRFGSRPLST